jgi:hypothetical protein
MDRNLLKHSIKKAHLLGMGKLSKQVSMVEMESTTHLNKIERRAVL